MLDRFSPVPIRSFPSDLQLRASCNQNPRDARQILAELAVAVSEAASSHSPGRAVLTLTDAFCAQRGTRSRPGLGFWKLEGLWPLSGCLNQASAGVRRRSLMRTDGCPSPAAGVTTTIPPHPSSLVKAWCHAKQRTRGGEWSP